MDAPFSEHVNGDGTLALFSEGQNEASNTLVDRLAPRVRPQGGIGRDTFEVAQVARARELVVSDGRDEHRGDDDTRDERYSGKPFEPREGGRAKM